MGLEEKLKQLGAKAAMLCSKLETEEATKNALIMPFLTALGYDVFDPEEVIPEFVADIGIKKGEKVDYAVKVGGDLVLLVEAKQANVALGDAHSSQLYRYFTATSARIGLLTNGVVYKFYSDLEQPNKMDEKPFLVVDITDLKEGDASELTKLSKEGFNLNQLLSAASEMKYLREIRAYLNEQFDAPSDEFLRPFVARCTATGRFTQSAREQFAPLVARALSQVIKERVSARLRTALATENEPGEPSVPESTERETSGAGAALEEASGGALERDNGIVTTDDEIEGYRIVKAIVCGVVGVERVAGRDTKGYFSVLLDDNNRKPICRLRFNRTQKYVRLFDADKNEERHPIESLEELYRFAEQLREAAVRYDAPNEAKAASGS